MAYENIKAEEFFKFLGVPEDVKDIDEAKDFYEKNYGKRSTIEAELEKDKNFVGKITGTRIGSIETLVKRLAKEDEIELGEGELKDKKVEDIISTVFQKVKGAYTNKIKEAESKIADPDKLKEDYEKKIETAIKERDFFKQEHQKVGEEFEGYKSQIATTTRNNTLKQNEEKVFSSIPFPKEANELLITGFKAKIKENVDFDLTEDGNFIVKGKDGNPIPNPHKASSFLSPEEYVKEEAVKAKLLTINPASGTPVYTPLKTTEAVETSKDVRIISKRALQSEL